MDDRNSTSIEFHALESSALFSCTLEGEIDPDRRDHRISVVPIIAVRDESDQLAILNLSIADNERLLQMFDEQLGDLQENSVKAFRLHVESEISNAALFDGKDALPVSLTIQIEFENLDFTSPPVEAFVRRNPKETRRAYKQQREKLFTFTVMTLFCFAWWGGNPFAGTWTTVCTGGCIWPLACACVGKGGGVCVGWLPCDCGFSLFGKHIPVYLLVALTFLLLATATVLLVF